MSGTNHNTPSGNNEYGFLEVVESGHLGDGRVLIIQRWTNLNTKAISIRTNAGGTWSGWQTIEAGMPSFYKNYGTLAELATALNVDALRGKFKILYGSVPSHSSVQVSCGNGLVFVGVYSGCTLYWPFYWSTAVPIIAGDENPSYTVTKSAQSRVVHITAPSDYSISYAYIGFTP